MDVIVVGVIGGIILLLLMNGIYYYGVKKVPFPSVRLFSSVSITIAVLTFLGLMLGCFLLTRCGSFPNLLLTSMAIGISGAFFVFLSFPFYMSVIRWWRQK